MNVQAEIEGLTDAIVRNKATQNFLCQHQALLESVARGSAYGGVVWLTVPTHAEAVRLMLALEGKFSKIVEESSGTVKYQQTREDKIIVLITSGTPPPSCHWVEEEVVTPAKPAHVVKVKKLVCNDGSNEGV